MQGPGPQGVPLKQKPSVTQGAAGGGLSSQAWEPWGLDSVEPQPVFIGEHQALISNLEGHGAQRGRCTGRAE